MDMAGMGPPPKPAGERVRRNPTIAMTALPAEGRKGAAPTWPLLPDIVLKTRAQLADGKVEDLRDKLNEAEIEGKPTAAIERRLDKALETLAILEAQVAEQRRLEDTLWLDLWRLPQACEWERLGWLRDVAQYVRHKVMAELGDLDAAKEARQWSDRLGLSPMAMLRLRWQVVVDEVAEKREQKSSGARGRIKAV
jgi:hypothetical protein